MATTLIPLYQGILPDINLNTDLEFSVNVEDINTYFSSTLPSGINVTIGELDTIASNVDTSETNAKSSEIIAKSSENAILSITNATKYDVTLTYAVDDKTIATNGLTYRCIATSIGDEPSISPLKWVNVNAIPLEELTDVPIKVAGKFLKATADGLGLEWSQAYAVAIDEISSDLQKVYTDATSFNYIIQNNTAPDMLVYKSMFREWFKVAGNSGFIDPLVSQNVYDNVINSPVALQLLATFDEGYDWLFDKIDNLAYSANIIAMIDAGSLDSIKTIHTFPLNDFDNLLYINRFNIVSSEKAYAYISSVSISNDTNTTFAHVSFESEKGLIDTPEISITANATLTPTAYTTGQYGGLLRLQESKFYARVDNNTGIANASVDIVSFARPSLIAIANDTPPASSCAIGDWACIVKEDLQKSIYDTTSFSQKINNGTTGNEIDYVGAYKTVSNDTTFINGLTIGSLIIDNICATPSLVKVALSASTGSVNLVNYFGANILALAIKIKKLISDAQLGGFLVSSDYIVTSVGFPVSTSVTGPLTVSVTTANTGRIVFLDNITTQVYLSGTSYYVTASSKSNGVDPDYTLSFYPYYEPSKTNLILDPNAGLIFSDGVSAMTSYSSEQAGYGIYSNYNEIL